MKTFLLTTGLICAVSSVLAFEIDISTFGEQVLTDFQSVSSESSSFFTAWEPDVRLTENDSVSTTLLNNSLNIASGPSDYVHVVWTDFRNGSPYSEIYYKRSTDGGVTWSTDARLTYDDAWSACPAIAVSDAKVHVVWMDSRNAYGMCIYYKFSTDQGTNWSPDILLADYCPDEPQLMPSIAVSGDDVHVVWRDVRSGNAEIYYKRSADGGISWLADTRLTAAPDSSTQASICASGSLVSVVWYDFRDGNPEIYYKRSTDGGISWSADTRLTDDTHNSLFPSVSSSGANVHVVWHDDRDGLPEIYYMRSTDSGASWSSATRLTFVPDYLSAHPSVAASWDNVHLVWHDTRDGNSEIYYNLSTDSGLSWGTDTRLTNAPDSSVYASAFLSGSEIHMVWTDQRDGNSEIYYKRDPTGNVGIEIGEGPGLPVTAVLHPLSPNPFSSSLNIGYSLPEPSQVELYVYNLAGKLINTLENGSVSTGEHTAVWNSDAFLPSGCYLIVLDADGDRSVRRCVKLD